MRKWLILPLWASIGIAVYACDDDTTNATKDGGTDAPAPTSTGTTPEVDAGMPDNYVPIEPKDAGPQKGPVTALVTTSAQTPSMGTDVYFNAIDGTTTKVTTGADGKATFSMYAGGSLTVDYVEVVDIGDGITQTSHYLTTVMALATGDTIHVVRPPPSILTFPGSISGTLANAPTVDAGGVNYSFEPYCGGFNITQGPFPESYTFNVSTDCLEVPTGKVPLLAVARDANNFTSVLSLASLIVNNPDGGTATANVAAGDWAAPTTKAMTFTGALPNGFSSSSMQIATPRNGELYLSTTGGAQGPIVGPLTYYLAPAAFSPVVQARTDVSGIGGPGEVLSLSRFQRVPSSTALAEDYTKLLPRIHTLKMAGTTAAPSFTWQVDAAFPADSFATIPLSGTHTPDGGSGQPISWQIVLPVDGTNAFTAPALPAALLAQVSPDSGWYNNQITVGESAQAPYALAHQYPAVLSNPQQFAPQIPPALTFDVRTAGVCQNCD